MLSVIKKNKAATAEKIIIITVAFTTASRVGQMILNHSARTPLIKSISCFIFPSISFLAGVVGIEPTPKVLETSILPLNYTPTTLHSFRNRPSPLCFAETLRPPLLARRRGARFPILALLGENRRTMPLLNPNNLSLNP